MFDLSSFDLAVWQWGLLAVCAILVGIAKTGIPGFGILVVPLMAIAMGDRAKVSVGLLLPILIFADVFAVIYHRRNVRWRHIVHLMPWALAGIATGAVLMGKINDEYLARLMGLIVLIMLGLRTWQNARSRAQGQIQVPQHWAFAAAMGFTAGLTTMMANAAGPVMILYLLAMRLPKTQFVGTAAWFFFFVNWTKVPLHVALGNITTTSLALDVCLFPFVPIGALLGVVALKKIPQKAFTVLIIILTAAAALKLLF